MYETYVTIQGNVATQLRSGLSRNGTPYASFRVASTIRRPTDDGWRDIATSYYNVSCYRQLAEHVTASLQIGHPVVVYGKQVVKEWHTEERRGNDVEIDAISVGHDLNRGTTLYAKHGRHRTLAEPSEPEPVADADGVVQPERLEQRDDEQRDDEQGDVEQRDVEQRDDERTDARAAEVAA